MTEQRTYLDRAAILAASDIQTEEVHVPEWGTWIRVKGLTARERDDWEDSCLTGKGKNQQVNMRNARARMVVRAAVDEQGNRLFQNHDTDSLGEKSGAAVDRIYDVAARLAGVSDRDMDDLTGNSETGPSAGSPSD